MKKPDFSQMINGQDIQQAEYNKPWTRKYSLTKEDVKQLKECWGPASLVPYPGTSSIESSSYLNHHCSDQKVRSRNYAF